MDSEEGFTGMIKKYFTTALTIIATTVAMSYLFKFWKRKYERKQIDFKRNPRNAPVKTKEDVNTKYEIYLEEMKVNEMKEEKERQLEYERASAKKKADFEKQVMDFELIEREDEMNSLKMKLESEERLKKLIEQKKINQVVKSKLANFEIERLKEQGKLEIEEIKRETKRSGEIHQRTISKMNDDFDEKQRKMEKESNVRKEEMELQERNANQRLCEMENQLEKDLEEMRRKSQQRKREMAEQILQIQQILRKRIWNEVIERNWTNRLNMLRSANQDVERLYNQMRNNSDLDSKYILIAIENQKLIMENEKNEMNKLYEETGKQFLLDIRDVVEEISSECDRFVYVLKNEPSNTSRIDGCHSALTRAYMEIPTLAELKQRYRESMNS